jgi:hypothetical protein
VLLVEQTAVVDDDAVEHPVELLVVDSVRSLDLAIEVGVEPITIEGVEIDPMELATAAKTTRTQSDANGTTGRRQRRGLNEGPNLPERSDTRSMP